MKATPLLLPAIVVAALSSIYFLPSAGEVAQSAIRMELPRVNGGWEFTDIPPSEGEINTLAKDTEFSKAICLRPRIGEYDESGRLIPDRVDLSIVLSGADINNSIHRPERCMPAQGHNILTSTDRRIDIGNGRNIVVKRLRSVQRIPINKENTEFAQLDCLSYYFFIGHDRITNDHYGRTFVDMKDRLLKGMDQRWAYVSTSTWFGKLPWMETEITEAEADAKLTDFVKRFSEEQINWDQVKP
jgi:hypothetical protein